MAEIILKMKLMVKGFPGVKALDANLIVERGEIHRLIGENGAGKSALAFSKNEKLLIPDEPRCPR